MLGRLARRAWNAAALSLEEMWFLKDPGAATTGAALDSAVRGHLDELRVLGVTVIRNAIDSSLCDAVVRDFGRYCADHPESDRYRDEHGMYERLACLHLTSQAARDVAFAPRIVALLEAAFRQPAVVVGSLYFDKGSTQSVHRDTPAFFTNPLNHFLGVWTALEDIKPGSGQLVYYERGHTVAPDRQLIARRDLNSRNYFELVAGECAARGLKLTHHYPRKGDTLVWHPALPHGGAAILDPRLSRRSIVFHYIPQGVPIHGAPVFFGDRGLVRRHVNYRIRTFGNREVIDQGAPRFFHNRHEGNFDEN